MFQKMNLIAWLEYELAYFKDSVQYFSHCTMETLLVRDEK